MSRWCLFVEGQTEKMGIERLLTAQGYKGRFAKRQIIALNGRGKFFSRTLAGQLLERSRGGALVAILLVDLYPLRPDGRTPEALKRSLRELVLSSLERMGGGLRDLRVHVAVHDFEAWLIGDPEAVEKVLQRRMNLPKSPEKIDGERPPKKFLEAYGYKETTHGPRMAELLNPERVAERCPSFRAFWEDITGLLK